MKQIMVLLRALLYRNDMPRLLHVYRGRINSRGEQYGNLGLEVTIRKNPFDNGDIGRYYINWKAAQGQKFSIEGSPRAAGYPVPPDFLTFAPGGLETSAVEEVSPGQYEGTVDVFYIDPETKQMLQTGETGFWLDIWQLAN